MMIVVRGFDLKSLGQSNQECQKLLTSVLTRLCTLAVSLQTYLYQHLFFAFDLPFLNPVLCFSLSISFSISLPLPPSLSLFLSLGLLIAIAKNDMHSGRGMHSRAVLRLAAPTATTSNLSNMSHPLKTLIAGCPASCARSFLRKVADLRHPAPVVH